jgi:hypothetical protein
VIGFYEQNGGFCVPYGTNGLTNGMNVNDTVSVIHFNKTPVVKDFEFLLRPP